MKSSINRVIISSAIGLSLVMATSAFAYYLLIVSPSIQREQIEFNMQKQKSEEILQKERIKRDCEDRKAEAAIENAKVDKPSAYLYQTLSDEC